ncbi:hypothetical protein J6590_050238 [Homalodisca vitripennis]|nr:hypothetical protein J6590_050238 [Homalodisca vitripennis]
MDSTERSRISRLLDSVERKEKHDRIRPTVRELFSNSDEEDVGITDVELSDADIDEEIELQHDEESIPSTENFVINDEISITYKHCP